MRNIKAKKSLGQHFLKDTNIAISIVDFLIADHVDHVVELGPGMGVLSNLIMTRFENCSFIEIDEDAVHYLKNKYPQIADKIIHRDFLKLDLDKAFKGTLALIGNFPYNISSQIMFKVLENRQKIVEIVGMFQKEVADRIISKPGNKVYGILSVFLQAYYHIDSLFSLGPECFNPPPKVNSSVIRFTRNTIKKLDCNEELFVKIVKQTFNQRRKMIRNSIRLVGVNDDFKSDYLTMRPEQLDVLQFVELTNQVELHLKPT